MSKEKVDAWMKTRCKKPMYHVINGKEMTFSCLRPRGHEGACCEAIVQYKDGHEPSDEQPAKEHIA